ncbi:hypothetical protein [Sciscionella marina]|uniref:hypothetical protein n=1 Tax=Sciscionella marina TaxID=508770 RepID=UPI0012F6E557|nr:hypothetical protein [Sciscionella marina]
MDELNAKLAERCPDLEIEYSSTRERKHEWSTRLSIPSECGEVSVVLRWSAAEDVRRIVQAVSSELVWLGRYAGFAELRQGYIEVLIRSLPLRSSDYRHRWNYDIDRSIFPDRRISARNNAQGISIEISPLGSLAGRFRSELMPTRELFMVPGLHYNTLKISLARPLRSECEAVGIAEHISSSLSYDLDVLAEHGFELCLRPEEEVPQDEVESKEDVEKPLKQPLSLSLNRYAAEALSYYWHARRSYDMPVVEYLNYYQVI